MGEAALCIGAISGTSMDSIDVAAMETDGNAFIERKGYGSYEYPLQAKNMLLSLGHPPAKEKIALAEPLVTDAFLASIQKFLEEKNLRAGDVSLVGCHGQTVFHDPSAKVTIQLCDNGRLAAELGIDVVGDFRSADVKKGGEGAPLAPAYHRALSSGLAKPVAFLNLGGVGNLTYVAKDGAMLAFDTGPANALVDDLVRERLSEEMDRQGRLAQSGKADMGMAKELSLDSWFDKPPPKSLDRHHFKKWLGKVSRLKTPDAAATLTEMSARCIARSIEHLPSPPLAWIVSGGGRHNSHMMGLIKEKLQSKTVAIDDELGINGDAIEAECFAYLAKRSVQSLPISYPGTTGVPKPLTGGTLFSKKGNRQQA